MADLTASVTTTPATVALTRPCTELSILLRDDATGNVRVHVDGHHAEGEYAILQAGMAIAVRSAKITGFTHQALSGSGTIDYTPTDFLWRE